MPAVLIVGLSQGVVSSVLINCDDARISLNTTPCRCSL